MKACRNVRKDATELLEGQLPFLAKLEARMHLLLCVHCRRYVRHLGLLTRTLALRGWADTPPLEFVGRVLERLESDPGRPADGAGSP